MKLLLNKEVGFIPYQMYLLEKKDESYKLSNIPLYLKENIRDYENTKQCLFCYLYDELAKKDKIKFENMVNDIEIKSFSKILKR